MIKTSMKSQFQEIVISKILTFTSESLPAMQETRVQFLGREDPLDEGNGNPLQHSCLENPMDGGA